MLNRYYGWYVDTGDLAAAERGLEAELEAWAGKHGKPIIITEYGADTVARPALRRRRSRGPRSTRPSCLEMYHRVFDRIDAVVGEHVWNFADFATTSGHHARRRQQEGRLHPRPPAEGRRARAAPALDRSALTGVTLPSPAGPFRQQVATDCRPGRAVRLAERRQHRRPARCRS